MVKAKKFKWGARRIEPTFNTTVDSRPTLLLFFVPRQERSKDSDSQVSKDNTLYFIHHNVS